MNEFAERLNDAQARLRAAVPPSYLTVSEAAGLARCHAKTIRRAVSSGALPAFRPAHRVLLREEDVRVWIESHAAARSRQAVRPRASRRARSEPGSVNQLREMERELTR